MTVKMATMGVSAFLPLLLRENLSSSAMTLRKKTIDPQLVQFLTTEGTMSNRTNNKKQI